MNCQQMGHYKSRCPNPHAEEEDAGGYGGGADANTGGDDNAVDGDAGGATWVSSSGGVGGNDAW